LVDLFCNQNDKVIWLPNVSDIKESVNYPIDIDVKGSPVANPMQYEDIVGESGFRWARVRLINTQADSLQFINDWLYLGTVRTTCEIIIENI